MPNNQLKGLYTLEQFKNFVAIVEKQNGFDEECNEKNLTRVESGWQYMATFRDDCNYKIPFLILFNLPEAMTIRWSEPRWNTDEPNSPGLFRYMMDNAIAEFEDVPGEETEAGYSWEGMTKINEREAAERFLNGLEVFLLHDDGTESACEDLTDFVHNIKDGGEFGVENGKTIEKQEEHQYLVQFRVRVAATSEFGAISEAIHKVEINECDVTVDDEGTSDNE